jgi:DNA repair protein RadC
MVASFFARTANEHHTDQSGANIATNFVGFDLPDSQPDALELAHSEGIVARLQPVRSTPSKGPRSSSKSAEGESYGDDSWIRLCSSLLSAKAEEIPDEDLLAFLLSYVEKSEDVRPVASDLISEFETLAGVLSACPDRIAGTVPDARCAVLFRAVRAIAARLAKEEISNRPVISSWQKLIDYLRTMMAHQRVEQFRVMFLDRVNVLISDEVLHEGTIDHTPVYPREVLKRALELDASAIIMVHNHPSNHPAPSRADIQMTRELKQALESVGLVLHDHLIVSRKGHTSFKEMQLI